MQTRDKIQITLTSCDPGGHYSRHVAAVMASIYANTSAPVCVHLLHDDTLTAHNRQKLLQTAEMFGQEIQFHNVAQYIDLSLLAVNERAHPGARGTAFRLQIPRLLDFDKVIYLDCDVLVHMDIAELWDIPLNDFAIAGAADVSGGGDIASCKRDFFGARALYRAMRVRNETYFNAGVLLMNLKKIRGMYDFEKRTKVFYEVFKNATRLSDQDVLNSIFCDDSFFLEEKFNRRGGLEPHEESAFGYIWHACCDDKWWSYYTKPGVDELYWSYLSRTSYYEDEKQFLGLVLQGGVSSKHMHLHSSDCVRKWKDKMKYNLTRGHLLLLPAILASCVNSYRRRGELFPEKVS